MLQNGHFDHSGIIYYIRAYYYIENETEEKNFFARLHDLY